MSLNLETEQSKILYLPLKDETLPNLKPHTTLTQNEHSKLNDIKSNTFDVCTGITKQSYSRNFLSEIHRTLKSGGVIMIQIGKETNISKDLSYSGFTGIESNSQQQITHWTARKPRTQIRSVPLKSKSESKSEEIMTSYKTSQTSLNNWFIPFRNVKIESLALNECILIIPTVSVGNIGQIAMDILLTTLISQKKIVKIGLINDRNIVSGIGNNGLNNGSVNVSIEVYYYKECNLVLIQQRSAVRMGGRSAYVNGMMAFIDRYKFAKIMVLTSEYITKRTESETMKGVKCVYYKSDMFGVSNSVFETLKWNVSFEGNKYRVIGHGITKKLYNECVREGKEVIVVCQYSEDGNNTKESEMYLDNLVTFVDRISVKCEQKLGGIKKWKRPLSLSFAHGGKLPNGIY